MNDTIEIHEEKDEGFTLVELLIVIVILGILATVTVFAVGGITSTAKENTCALEKKTIETAITGYQVEFPNAVPTEQNLVDEDYLDGLSTKWDITAGEVVPQTGGGCEAPTT